MLRRGRGYRDHEYLLLKVQKATAERIVEGRMNTEPRTDFGEDRFFDLACGLQRRGIQVDCWVVENCPEAPLPRLLQHRGITVLDSPPAGRYDAVVFQLRETFGFFRTQYRGTRKFGVCHGPKLPDEVPPSDLENLTAVALTREGEEYLRQVGHRRVVWVGYGVDLARFRLVRRIAERPRVAVVLSQYADCGPIRAACSRLGVEVRELGRESWAPGSRLNHYGGLVRVGHGGEVIDGNRERVAFHVERYLNEADVVFGPGRSAVEAMATGRACVVYGYGRVGGGMVMAENGRELARRNFSGRWVAREFDAEALLEELRKYRPEMGEENRGFVEAEYDLEPSLERWVELLGDRKGGGAVLEWTGERYLPWLSGIGGEIHYEHLLRYAFALQFVEGKTVLDLGSGEGYGAFLMASKAARVVGVDIDAESVRHARNRYEYRLGNLTFLEGSVTRVPVSEAGSFDVVVCFEVLEHVAEHRELVAEVRRLLKPGGLFIVSTPNKAVYSDETGYRKPFHVRELYFDEFRELLRSAFGHMVVLGQRVYPGAFIWPLASGGEGRTAELVVERVGRGFELREATRKEPTYLIGVASDDPLPEGVCLSVSLLDLSNAYAEELVEQQVKPRRLALEQRIRALEGELGVRDRRVTGLESELRRLSEHIAELGAASARWREEHARALEQVRREVGAQLSLLVFRSGVLWRFVAPVRALVRRPRHWFAGRAPRLVVDEPNLSVRPRLSGKVRVTGWAASGWAEVERVEVLCDGHLIGDATLGLPRPDVGAAWPELHAADRSGFTLDWDLDGVPPAGTSSPSVPGTGRGGWRRRRVPSSWGACSLQPCPSRGASAIRERAPRASRLHPRPGGGSP